MFHMRLGQFTVQLQARRGSIPLAVSFSRNVVAAV